MTRWASAPRALVSMVVASGLACGGAPPPPPPPAPVVAVAPPPAPPPPPACIAVPDDAAGITNATARAGGVDYCLGASCYSLDLPGGKLSRLAHPPAPAPAGSDVAVIAASTETDQDIGICSGSGGDCKVLARKLFPGTGPLHAVTNAAGSVVAVALGDGETNKGYVEVWDVATQKRTASFRYGSGDYRCGDLAMVGDTIYVSASVCAGPSARGALFTLKGKRIASVGGNDFGTYGDARVQLDPTTWAFLEETASRIAVQDVVKGKVKKTVDVSALWKKEGDADGQAFGNPGESALVMMADGKLAVVAGSPVNGSVATVDPASGEVVVVRAPQCGGSGAAAGGAAATAPAGP